MVQLSFVLCIAVMFVMTIALLSMISTNRDLQKSNNSLREEVSKLTSEVSKSKKDKQELVSIDPGDKAIVADFHLVYGQGTSNEIKFSVTYEVEIIEISMDKVKVKATDFIANDKTGRDPIYKQSILDFMQNKWIDKKDVELVVDNSMRRDAKLQEILGDK